jgi:hypothetical protein
MKPANQKLAVWHYPLRLDQLYHHYVFTASLLRYILILYSRLLPSFKVAACQAISPPQFSTHVLALTFQARAQQVLIHPS